MSVQVTRVTSAPCFPFPASASAGVCTAACALRRPSRFALTCVGKTLCYPHVPTLSVV
jgi:hypothetical protein